MVWSINSGLIVLVAVWIRRGQIVTDVVVLEVALLYKYIDEYDTEYSTWTVRISYEACPHRTFVT